MFKNNFITISLFVNNKHRLLLIINQEVVMKSLFNKVEKLIFLLFLSCFILLLTVQFLSYSSDYDHYTYNMIRNNKLLTLNDEKINEKGIIVLKNMTQNHEDIKILLNGEPIGEFYNDEVKIYVRNNDIIEIDGTKYDDQLKVKVIGVSKNVETPKLDTTVITFQSIEILSRVKLK